MRKLIFLLVLLLLSSVTFSQVPGKGNFFNPKERDQLILQTWNYQLLEVGESGGTNLGKLIFWSNESRKDKAASSSRHISFYVYPLKDSTGCLEISNNVLATSPCTGDLAGGEMIVLSNYILLNSGHCSCNDGRCKREINFLLSFIKPSATASLRQLFSQLPIRRGIFKG